MLYGKKVIALCIANAGDWRNFQFVSSLNNVLQENGHKLFVYHTCTDFYRGMRGEEGEKAVFDLMDYEVIDAVVVFSESFRDRSVPELIFAAAKKHNTPVVSVGGEWKDGTELACGDCPPSDCTGHCASCVYRPF